MSDVLAIVGPGEDDAELIEQLARGRADRITILVEDAEPDWGSDDSEAGRAVRERLAGLLAAIERRTGAMVVGLAGSRDQLLGWRFDRIVQGRAPLAA
jgi:hypothetical protein